MAKLTNHVQRTNLWHHRQGNIFHLPLKTRLPNSSFQKSELPPPRRLPYTHKQFTQIRKPFKPNDKLQWINYVEQHSTSD